MGECEIPLFFDRFTFQYASIKPLEHAQDSIDFLAFTFQYASIKPSFFISKILFTNWSLHFNMLLLNLITLSVKVISVDEFTFQYASIKPWY